MERQVLLDATDVGYLLQIAVELLIGDYRHELAVGVAALIFVEDFQAGGSRGTITFVLVF